MVLQHRPRLPRIHGPYRPPRGPEFPEDLLSQFLAAASADDLETFKTLLDEHFPDRTKVYAGIYRIYRLNPVLTYAAEQDRAAIIAQLLQYPFHTYQFIARDAIAVKAKNTLLVLLENGWDINETFGSTGLTYLAYSMGDREMVLWLIEHGANPNYRPFIDTTAMSMAVQHAPPDLIRELLDQYGGDVHCGQLMQHALDRPLADDVVEVLRILLDRGASLHATMYASDAQSYSMYFFMEFGTPLHKAAKLGNIEAVEYLLSQGADTSICSSKGKTALEWAEKAGHQSVAARLRSPDKYKL